MSCRKIRQIGASACLALTFATASAAPYNDDRVRASDGHGAQPSIAAEQPITAGQLIAVGQTLAAALRMLSTHYGLTTVFTAERIPDHLQVRQMPANADPLALRAALLAEHGLGCHYVLTRCVVEPLPPPTAPIHRVRAAIAPTSAELRLPTIEATASHYAMAVQGATFLSAADVAATPHLADDVFRLARSVPGVAGGDIAAPFHIRGGHADEVALRIDGLELYRPFHLHSLVNALGIIDSNLIGSVDVYTGVQPSRLGGRMSGAVDIRSRPVPAEREHRLGVSAMNAFYTYADSSDDGRRGVLASARRGYLDVVLEFVDAGGDIDPKYYDFFVRFEQQVGERHTLSTQLLQAGDDIAFTGDSGNVHANGGSDATYAWLRWQTDWAPAWSSEWLLASTQLDRERYGFKRVPFERAVVDDQRALDGQQIAHRLSWQVDVDTALELGAEWRQESTDYAYHATGEIAPLQSPTAVALQRNFVQTVEGSQGAAWLDVETSLGAHWQLGAGLRHALSKSGSRKASVLDPHAMLGWHPRDGTRLHLSLGRASQSQRVDELTVEDGDSTFHGAERMDVAALRVEHALDDRHALSVELFDKRWHDPRPRYENVFNAIEFFPETERDRIRVDADRARSRGIELGLHARYARGRWWTRYAYAQTRERVAGDWQPRSWDQPHSLHAGWDRHFDNGWRLTTQLDAHSGWPTTPLTAIATDDGGYRLVLGPRNSTRYHHYLNLSARISRERTLANGDALLWYFEVFNLLNRENASSVVDFDVYGNANGDPRVDREFGGGLPILPSFGVAWRF